MLQKNGSKDYLSNLSLNPTLSMNRRNYVLDKIIEKLAARMYWVVVVSVAAQHLSLVNCGLTGD